jgi:hypothetical protein
VANRWQCVGVGNFLSGAWNGELATMSFSGVARDTGSFGTDDINQALPEFAAVPSGASSTTAHCTVSYGSEGVGGWTEANQNSIIEAMWTFLNTLKAYQASAFSWGEIRLSAIESTGAVVNGATVATITSPLQGTPTMNAPPQLAVASSHVTGGRGPRNRGRNYMPIHSYTSNSTTDGLVATSVKTAVNNAAKAFIDTVNAVSGLRTAVVSGTHQTYSDITAVRVGDEFDTQRRRKNGRRETYTTLTV